METNKEKIKEYNKKYYQENKDKIKTYNNDPKIKERLKEYNKKNKEKIAAHNRKYYQRNKQTLLKTMVEYNNNRYRTDPLFTAKQKLRVAVGQSFRRIGKSKPTYTEALLGCSWEEAKLHFEKLFQPGMSWLNQGEWHIDHIRPVSDWKDDELHLMNHISNLQPLWSEDNLAKGDKILDHKLPSFL